MENRINGNFQCYQKLEEQKGKKLDYDIVVCGGTLGIFFATALLLQGHKVCVVEAGKLQGREQEWNISMEELLVLKNGHSDADRYRRCDPDRVSGMPVGL